MYTGNFFLHIYGCLIFISVLFDFSSHLFPRFLLFLTFGRSYTVQFLCMLKRYNAKNIEWFIEDQAFSPSYYLAPPPPPQPVISIYLYPCVSPVKLTDGKHTIARNPGPLWIIKNSLVQCQQVKQAKSYVNGMILKLSSTIALFFT